jgi:hypothetical protein
VARSSDESDSESDVLLGHDGKAQLASGLLDENGVGAISIGDDMLL